MSAISNTNFVSFLKNEHQASFILKVTELSQTTLLDFKLILVQSKFKIAHIHKQGILLYLTLLECASS